MIGHILDHDLYLGKLTEGVIDKAQFIPDNINLVNTILVDYGCADGFVGDFLTKTVKSPGFEYIGYDYDPEMIHKGNLNYPGLNLTYDKDDLWKLYNNKKDIVIFLSSTLHELLPFPAEMKKLITLIRMIRPKYIVIRDMYHTGPHRDLVHILLKTAYVDNFVHEMDEEYFAWTDKEVKFEAGNHQYEFETIYDEVYLPYWIKDRFDKLAEIDGYDWVDEVTTHRKLILKRNKVNS